MGFLSEVVEDCSIGSFLMVGFEDCDDGEEESRHIMVNLGLVGIEESGLWRRNWGLLVKEED